MNKPPRFEGEQHPKAKLSNATVRRLRRIGPHDTAVLADRLGVHRRTVQRMLTGKSYRNVDE